MAGGIHAPEQPINWAEKYIEKLSRDMEDIRGMESRINGKFDTMQNKFDGKFDTMQNKINSMQMDLQGRIDANNKQTQNLVLAMIIGIGAMTIAIAIAFR